MRKSRDFSDYVLDVLVALILVVVLVVTLYPFWYILIVSINDATDTIKGGLYFLPKKNKFCKLSDNFSR